MPRPKRISFPGAVYHICVRGNARQIIFKDDYDCSRFLALLKRYKQKFNFFLYAYVLMPNHIHLVVEISEEATISKIMQSLNTAYGHYFNSRHHRRGHLLQNRFFSNLIAKDNYLLEVTRYVHLNPLRAGLVKSPLSYKWSSFPVYAGKRNDDLVDKALVLEMVDKEKSRQLQKYTEFILAVRGVDAKTIRSRLTKNKIIGNPDFVQQISIKYLGSPKRGRGRPRKHKK